jgi:hypothetical protein
MAGVQTLPSRQRARVLEAYRGRGHRNSNLWLVYSVKQDQDLLLHSDRSLVHWLTFLEGDPDVTGFAPIPDQNQLGAEKIARHTAEQRVLDLNGRLADAERDQASLEEKHKHARDGLEHYRTAAKEQREQEQRRHEHQVHGLQTELKQAQLAFSLKQEELTRLNKEAAALATELGSVKQALHLEREASRN